MQDDFPPPPSKPMGSGVIDFDHPYEGRIGDDAMMKMYGGGRKKIGFNGDYRVPQDLRAAIENAGRLLLAYAEQNGIDLVKFGFDINNDGKVGPQEAGSGCCSFALESGSRLAPGKTTKEIVSFFADGTFKIRTPLKGEKWRVAEQVLGDNWPTLVDKPTNTEDADKSFMGWYKGSSNDGLIR